MMINKGKDSNRKTIEEISVSQISKESVFTEKKERKKATCMHQINTATTATYFT
jgi:hypothetical protein